MSVAIIIPTWNNLPFLMQAVGSIKDLTPRDSYRLIVAVNEGKDGTAEWCKENGIEHVLFPENVGYAVAVNACLPMVSDMDFMRMDDDVRVCQSDWIKTMQSNFADPTIGSVGPISNFVMGSQLFVRQGLPMVHDAPFLVGFCHLTRKEAMAKIGALDENFPFNGTDDLCLEVEKHGWRNVVDRRVFVYHFGATSSKKLGGYDEIFRKVRPLVKAKWGDDIFEKMDRKTAEICSSAFDPDFLGFRDRVMSR